MNEQEAIDIHNQLWHDACEIEYRYVKFNVKSKNNPHKQYHMVTLPGGIILVTQNLAKPSPNTTWCSLSSTNQLTWIIKNNQYIGKVTSELKDGHLIYTVYKLSPERPIYVLEK